MSVVPSTKSALCAASIVPLMAPADAPATIANGDGPPRRDASSLMRFRTPA